MAYAMSGDEGTGAVPLVAINYQADSLSAASTLHPALGGGHQVGEPTPTVLDPTTSPPVLDAPFLGLGPSTTASSATPIPLGLHKQRYPPRARAGHSSTGSHPPATLEASVRTAPAAKGDLQAMREPSPFVGSLHVAPPQPPRSRTQSSPCSHRFSTSHLIHTETANAFPSRSIVEANSVEDLADILRQSSDAPYAVIYIELDGQLRGRATDAFLSRTHAHWLRDLPFDLQKDWGARLPSTVNAEPTPRTLAVKESAAAPPTGRKPAPGWPPAVNSAHPVRCISAEAWSEEHFDSSRIDSVQSAGRRSSDAKDTQAYKQVDSEKMDSSSDDDAQQTVQMVIGDTDAVTNFYESRFKHLQQIPCKSIAKDWIKVIEPKKQTMYPYNGGLKGSRDETSKRDSLATLPNENNKDSLNPGEKTRPPWWPQNCRHREPDHIEKHERLTLLLHLLRNLWDPNGAETHQCASAAVLRRSTVKTVSAWRHQAKYEENGRWLADIYRMREFEERLIREEIDPSTLVTFPAIPDVRRDSRRSRHLPLYWSSGANPGRVPLAPRSSSMQDWATPRRPPLALENNATTESLRAIIPPEDASSAPRSFNAAQTPLYDHTRETGSAALDPYSPPGAGAYPYPTNYGHVRSGVTASPVRKRSVDTMNQNGFTSGIAHYDNAGPSTTSPSTYSTNTYVQHSHQPTYYFGSSRPVSQLPVANRLPSRINYAVSETSTGTMSQGDADSPSGPAPPPSSYQAPSALSAAHLSGQASPWSFPSPVHRVGQVSNTPAWPNLYPEYGGYNGGGGNVAHQHQHGGVPRVMEGARLEGHPLPPGFPFSSAPEFSTTSGEWSAYP